MHFAEFVAMVKATCDEHQIGRVLDISDTALTVENIVKRSDSRGICCNLNLDVDGNLTADQNKTAANCVFSVTPTVVDILTRC